MARQSARAAGVAAVRVYVGFGRAHANRISGADVRNVWREREDDMKTLMERLKECMKSREQRKSEATIKRLKGIYERNRDELNAQQESGSKSRSRGPVL